MELKRNGLSEFILTDAPPGLFYVRCYSISSSLQLTYNRELYTIKYHISVL